MQNKKQNSTISLSNTTDSNGSFPSELIEEFKTAFNLFDKDGDGFLSIQELRSVFTALQKPITDEELDQLMQDLDTDGNGRIDFTEFMTFMSKNVSSQTEEEEIREAFEVFDKNQDGRISFDELKQILTSLGQNLMDSEIAALIKEVDENKDGFIDFEEFRNLYKTLSNE